MENNSLIPYTAGLEKQTTRSISGEIVTLPPEMAGLQQFYSLLRRSTLEAIDLADQLIRDDPDSPDPETNPDAHKNFAMHKYGIHLKLPQIPDMPDYQGIFSIPRFLRLVESAPPTYSPGYKSPSLNSFGFSDSAEAVISGATTLIDHADFYKPLRPAFKNFPAKRLAEMEVWPETISAEETHRKFIRKIIPDIDNFRTYQLKKVLSWQRHNITIDIHNT